MSYVRKHFGWHPVIAGLVAFGFALQDGRPFDFVSGTAARDDAAERHDVGLRADGNNYVGSLLPADGRAARLL